MNIKAVFFDIDGTFYDHTTNRVLPSTKEAVRKLKEQGIKVALCSGRPLQLAAELPVFDEFCWDGFIGGSGISVYDENRELIWENAFTEDQLKKLFAIAEKHELPLYVNGEKTFLTRPLPAKKEFVLELFHLGVPEIRSWNHERVDVLSIFENRDYDFRMFQTVENIRMQPSCDYIMDILKKDTCKATGIKQLMAYWGLENEAYMAFGDSMNDCEMLQEAAVGVAMGNAMDAVKAYADHICGSSDTPAIHNTLQAYGLIH